MNKITYRSILNTNSSSDSNTDYEVKLSTNYYVMSFNKLTKLG